MESVVVGENGSLNLSGEISMPAKKKKGARKGARKGGARRKGAARKKSAGRRKSAKRKSSGRKRAPNPAFMKPMQPDAALAAVVGDRPMPRTEITKKLWQYIKRNGLQDAKERRMINADDRLGRVFGGKKQVSMFEMTKLVNRHMG
jgi:chromatin remodeling complex protein RSC6